MSGRKLEATFKDGQVLRRTTSIPTLTHAWKVQGTHPSRSTPATITGFASGAENATKACYRELPASRGWTVTSTEVVECKVLP